MTDPASARRSDVVKKAQEAGFRGGVKSILGIGTLHCALEYAGAHVQLNARHNKDALQLYDNQLHWWELTSTRISKTGGSNSCLEPWASLQPRITQQSKLFTTKFVWKARKE
ncbi:hypothetical protein AAMO2058_000655900 [Amorphochlora amoebiformis]